MKSRIILKIYSFLLLIFILSCASGTSRVFIKDRATLNSQIKIAVLPFKDAPSVNGSGEIVADSFANEAIRMRNWDLVERAQLEKIVKEQQLDISGLTQGGDINKIGDILNVNVLVMGTVTEYKYDKLLFYPRVTLGINIRMIDVKTGQVLGTGSYEIQTGKNAWIGCCLLGWYYVPIMLFHTESMPDRVKTGCLDILKRISREIE